MKDSIRLKKKIVTITARLSLAIANNSEYSLKDYNIKYVLRDESRRFMF